MTSRPPRRLAAHARRLVALAALGAAALALDPPPASRAGDPWSESRRRFSAESTRTQHMLERGRGDSALALADSLARSAAAAGDRLGQARFRLLQASLATALDPAAAAAPLAEGRALAEALADSSTLQLALRVAGVASFFGGDLPAAERSAGLALAMAERRGDLQHAALARVLFAYLGLQRGDAAAVRRHIAAAAAGFERTGDVTQLANAWNTLGNVLVAEGDFTGARQLYERAYALADDGRHERIRIVLLGNLGVIEARIGDPARAVHYYREALAAHERRGEFPQLPTDYYNVASALGKLGRHAEAARVIAAGIDVVRTRGLGKDLPLLLHLQAELLAQMGRPNAAKAVLRELFALDALDADSRAYGTHVLAGLLAAEDSLGAALAALRADPARPRAVQELQAILMDDEVTVLLRLGRPGEAMARVRPLAEALARSGDHERALASWTSFALAAHAAGERAERGRALALATRIWEDGRRRITDPELRELRGEQASRLATLAVLDALDAPGAGRFPAAFERAQAFKTRTLLERMAGPRAFLPDSLGRFDPPGATVARLGSEVLRPGELFLEFVAGPDTTFLFALTRDSLRVLGLPGGRALAPALDLTRELCRTPPAGAADDAATGALAAAGARLLGGVADLVDGATTVIVSADGPLQRIPFAALTLPGSDRPLAARVRLVHSPSATLLAVLRARPVPAADGILAIAGPAPPGEAPLPGAARELRELAGRYRGVVRWRGGPGAARPLATAALGGYRVLHYAGHTEVDDQLPWRSGLRLRAGARDSLLIASEIAAARLGVRLVVLSSCQSVGGRARPGEGVQGLASAFLAAGAPAVVATLWPVDDQATARFMARFYDQLAGGRSPAAALQAAQEWMRARPDTRAPFFWAGFVLIGDDLAAPLVERRPWPLRTGVAPWLAIAVLGLVVLLGRRAGREA